MHEQTREIRSSMLIRLIAFFTRQHKPLLVIFCYLAIWIIGVIDYLTGVEIALSIFYVIPVAILTLSTNRRNGFIISFFAGTVWLAADLLAKHAYSHPLIPWWNATVRFSFFAIVTHLAAALKKMYEREESMARTDFLTGIANRRLLFESAQSRFSRPNASGLPFTTIYLDLDNFKKINDNLGHAVGDSVLQTVGEIIRKNLRKTDVVARIGGDEFVIMLSGTGANDSEHLTEKIRGKIIEEAHKQRWPISVTMGAVTFLKLPASVDEMIKMADDLMYEAKEAGKNTIKFKSWDG